MPKFRLYYGIGVLDAGSTKQDVFSKKKKQNKTGCKPMVQNSKSIICKIKSNDIWQLEIFEPINLSTQFFLIKLKYSIYLFVKEIHL